MIDVDAAKAWIKPDNDDDDALIQSLIAAAVSTIEAQTGKYLSSQAVVLDLPSFPDCDRELLLRRGPFTAITEIAYDPSDGSAEATIADFRLVEGYGKSFNGALRPAFGESWPLTLRGSGVVRISGVAGYDDGEAPDLDQAVLRLVAHWYLNREAVSTNGTPAELPLSVSMLINPYRPAGLA